jgi:F0F1-type ATP synthase assembly protein I
MHQGLPNPKEMGRYLAIGQIGLEMVAPIILGLLLDYQLGWMPWATVVGAILGLAGGISHLVVISNRSENKQDSQRPQEDK